jgi:glycerol-3-phosphate O-acyltransferase / dihydroxyacetone phosphate acyltransferase
MSRLARLLVRVFFRRIDVEGAERMPADGPLVLVANHVNGLVDGLVLMAVLPRYPRFLGKATLYRILPLAPFLHLAGVVPVHRAKDAEGASGRAVTRNDAAFRTSRELLAAGGLVALFPEGISHDEAKLQPLRTGAARIALGATFDDSVAGVTTQAAGLIYADKARFRSHALVRIGPPEGVEQREQAYEADPVAAVRALTDRLGQQLAAVAPMYDSRQDELAYRRVASIAARDPATQDDVARALSTAAQRGPAAAAVVAELTATTECYESDLSLLGLSDDDLARGLTPADYKRRIGRSALTAALTAPLAVIGAVIHFVPYQIMKQVGKRPSEGMRATVKLFGCTALFTAVYGAIGIRAGRRRGPMAGLAGFLLGPLSGYVTVRWAERMDRLGGLAQARAVIAERGDLLGDLAARRADVVARTEAITGEPPARVPAAR